MNNRLIRNPLLNICSEPTIKTYHSESMVTLLEKMQSQLGESKLVFTVDSPAELKIGN